MNGKSGCRGIPTPELKPDAWERFERAVDVVAKSAAASDETKSAKASCKIERRRILIAKIKRVAAVPRSTASYLAALLVDRLGRRALEGANLDALRPRFFAFPFGNASYLISHLTHLLSGLLPPFAATVIRPRKADGGQPQSIPDSLSLVEFFALTPTHKTLCLAANTLASRPLPNWPWSAQAVRPSIGQPLALDASRRDFGAHKFVHAKRRAV